MTSGCLRIHFIMPDGKQHLAGNTEPGRASLAFLIRNIEEKQFVRICRMSTVYHKHALGVLRLRYITLWDVISRILYIREKYID